MNYKLNQPKIDFRYASTESSKEELVKEVISLSAWKYKASIQLQHFLTACRLYNFCDASQLEELLNPPEVTATANLPVNTAQVKPGLPARKQTK